LSEDLMPFRKKHIAARKGMAADSNYVE